MNFIIATKRGLATLIYRHRRAAKYAVTVLNKLLPRSVSRKITHLAEKTAFLVGPDFKSDLLPPIFHYWSHKYLAPKLSELGIRSPEHLFLSRAMEYAKQHKQEDSISLVSYGCGIAEVELDMLAKLHRSGIKAYMDCVDFNSGLLRKARDHALEMRLSDYFRTYEQDCNRLEPTKNYDIIIVNQFFHHVENIENFCETLRHQLKPDGLLLTCDVIGQNGHVPWPSVDRYVQSAWATLAPEKRHDKHFGTQKDRYISIDPSQYSNEGIRAQDIVSVLLENFDFELFLTYGASIIPFIERRIGFNFAPDDEADRKFIDQVAAADERSLAMAEYPASNMLAVLKHRGTVGEPIHLPITPQKHAELTRAEMLKASA